MVYFGTRMSENISRREPEGYLICLNVPVARTGIQEYLPSELGMEGPDDRMIPVRRPEEEVFSAACIASFEGMPVTDDHPGDPEGVYAENSGRLQKGHAHHVRRGTGEERDLLLADLIITDPGLRDEILDGKREISCGYNYVLCEEDGEYIQREIRGNHVAVVENGRAGPRVSIRDQKAKFSLKKRKERGMDMKKKVNWRAKVMARMARDGDVEGLSEIIGEILEEEGDVPGMTEMVEEAIEAVSTETVSTETVSTEEKEAPILVETPVEQPVVIDCGAQILAALKEMIEIMRGGHGVAAGDEAAAGETVNEAIEAAAAGAAAGPAAAGVGAAAGTVAAGVGAAAGEAASAAEAEEVAEAAEAVAAATEAAAESMAEMAESVAAAAMEAVGEAAEAGSAAVEAAEETAEEAVENAVSGAEALTGAASAGALAGAPTGIGTGAAGSGTQGGTGAAGGGMDPVDELVAEILEGMDEDGEEREEQALGSDGEEEVILSSILDPADLEDCDPDANATAADALRAALVPFRGQLKKMSPAERKRFNADVAARMARMTKKQGKGKLNSYAAMRMGKGMDASGKSLGKKIMESRNANLRK